MYAFFPFCPLRRLPLPINHSLKRSLKHLKTMVSVGMICHVFSVQTYIRNLYAVCVIVIYTSERRGCDKGGEGSKNNPFRTVLQAMRFARTEPFPPIMVDHKKIESVRGFTVYAHTHTHARTHTHTHTHIHAHTHTNTHTHTHTHAHTHTHIHAHTHTNTHTHTHARTHTHTHIHAHTHTNTHTHTHTHIHAHTHTNTHTHTHARTHTHTHTYTHTHTHTHTHTLVLSHFTLNCIVGYTLFFLLKGYEPVSSSQLKKVTKLWQKEQYKQAEKQKKDVRNDSLIPHVHSLLCV